MNAVVHLRLGTRPVPGLVSGDTWVAECGHYASAERSTHDRELVTCKLCKRTRAYRGR